MKHAGVIGLLALALAGSSAIADIKNVLHYKKVDGFLHSGAIRACQEMLDTLAAQHGFSVKHSEDEADILDIGRYDLVVFDNNTASQGPGPADPLRRDPRSVLPSEEAMQALKAYVEGGGSWLGFHNVARFGCKGWDWYKKVLFSGNCFAGHGGDTWTLEVDSNLTDDPELSAMWEAAGFESAVTFSTEKFRFKSNNSVIAPGDLSMRDDPNVKVLQKMTKDDEDYEDHFFTWTKAIGRGRILYTALGHSEMDFIQNDKWLQRATWHWMKYLDGQYAGSAPIRADGGRPNTPHEEASQIRQTTLYDLSGRFVATLPGRVHPGMEFNEAVKPGIHFAQIESPSGVSMKKVVIP